MATQTHSVDSGNIEKNIKIEAIFVKQETPFEEENTSIKCEHDFDQTLSNLNYIKPKLEDFGTKFHVTQYSNNDLTATIKNEIEVVEENLCNSVKQSEKNCMRKATTINESQIDVKKHKCTHCIKSFKYKCYLETHMLIHSGLKPHECKHCKKKFTQASHLKIHSLIHSDLKPHQCQYCKKAFRARCSLNRHVLAHDGIKPYQCQHCQKGFNMYSRLKTHLLTHIRKKLRNVFHS